MEGSPIQTSKCCSLGSVPSPTGSRQRGACCTESYLQFPHFIVGGTRRLYRRGLGGGPRPEDPEAVALGGSKACVLHYHPHALVTIVTEGHRPVSAAHVSPCVCRGGLCVSPVTTPNFGCIPVLARRCVSHTHAKWQPLQTPGIQTFVNKVPLHHRHLREALQLTSTWGGLFAPLPPFLADKVLGPQGHLPRWPHVPVPCGPFSEATRSPTDCKHKTGKGWLRRKGGSPSPKGSPIPSVFKPRHSGGKAPGRRNPDV